MNFTCNELLDIIGGRLYKGNDKWSFDGCTIDSREPCMDKIFFAIYTGKNDGHNYINDAINNGCICVICDNEFKAKHLNKGNCILVDNVEQSMIKLARHSRKISNAIFIAITGSVGKTTCKESLFEFIKNKFISYVSKKSYNNKYGVSLTLINMPRYCDVCICEVGTNNFGEIEFLSEIIKPHISIITNVSRAHIGYFLDISFTTIEKTSIFKHTSIAGIVTDQIIYTDIINKYLQENNINIPIFKVKYDGIKKDHISYFFNNDKLNLYVNKNLCNIFHVNNKENMSIKIAILSACSIVEYIRKNDLINSINNSNAFNISIDDLYKFIYKNISNNTENNLIDIIKETDLPGRNQIKYSHINNICQIYDSSFNSNPDSLIYSLQDYHKKTSIFNRYCVIGEYSDLGTYSRFYSDLIIKYLIIYKFKEVIFIGGEIENTYRKCNDIIKCFLFDNVQEAMNEFYNFNKKAYSIFIKGSNSNNLFHLNKINNNK